jgi:phage terminase large subunit-like protein
VDEIHAHKNPDLYTALTTGTGARDQPFTFWITTAGGSPDGLLAGLYDQMLTGTGELERRRPGLMIYRDRANGILIWWYGAERTADIEDPAVWLSANPASWLQDLKYLRREFGRLKSRGALAEWRTFHLNQFVWNEEQWLPPGAWNAARAAGTLDVDLPLGVGIFKTADSAHAAIATCQRQGNRIVSHVEWYGPTELTGRVDVQRMRAYLRDLRARFPKPATFDAKTRMRIFGPAFAFDRWAFSESAEELDQEGLNMVDFPQYASTMGPATTQAYELVTTGRLTHDGDATLGEHIDATMAVLTDRGMKAVPNRKKGTRPNHGAIALIMASAMAMLEAPRPFVDTRKAIGW